MTLEHSARDISECATTINVYIQYGDSEKRGQKNMYNLSGVYKTRKS